MRKLEIGETIHISTGSYSDYSVTGVFKVIRAFHPGDLVAEYGKAFPETTKKYCASFEKFVSYLCEMELIEQVESVEFHLGDYGEFELDLPGEKP